MLKHIVLFKLKSNYNDQEKQQAKKEIADVLKKLPEYIPEILYYEVIENQANRLGGSEIGIISGFKNFDELNTYRNHHKHIEAVEVIKRHSESSTYLDYTNHISLFKK
jgi:hypothetical protein